MVDRLVRRGTIALILAGLLAVVVAIGLRMVEDAVTADGTGVGRKRGEGGPAPVAVAPITTGKVREYLRIVGDLQASANFDVSSRVGGRVLSLAVDVGDRIKRGGLVARIDDRSYRQDELQAQAAVAVAEARLAEAQSQVDVVKRDAERASLLFERQVASEADRDRAVSEQRAAEAAVRVATAQVDAARAELIEAGIRLQDCGVAATWQDADLERVIGQRYIDDGVTIGVGDAIVSVLRIAPLTAVLHVTETTYGRIQVGQAVSLQTDAWPEEQFAAQVARIAPRFDERTRQARVELSVPNDDGRLKPGMFVRAELILAEVADATLVPERALVSRQGQPAVFVVNAAGTQVQRVPVKVGLRGDDVVQVAGEGLTGRVVVLGHHLIRDGSTITIPPGADGTTRQKNDKAADVEARKGIAP